MCVTVVNILLNNSKFRAKMVVSCVTCFLNSVARGLLKLNQMISVFLCSAFVFDPRANRLFRSWGKSSFSEQECRLFIIKLSSC